jgi:antirestriction protein
MLREYGDAWAAFCSHYGLNHATREGFLDSFAGTFDSLEAYAQDYVDSTGLLADVPERVSRYFDVGAFARDLRLGGDVAAVEVEGGVAIFHNL